MEVMRNIRCILQILEVAMGLKVNLSKSILSPVGMVPNLEELATVLGCLVVPLSTTYLGHSLVLKRPQNPFGILL